MRAEDLIVEVRNASLQRVGLIPTDYLVGFNAVLRYNAIGVWNFSLPRTHALANALATPGAGIVATYKGQTLISGPAVWAQSVYTADNANGTLEVTGLDDSVILRDRLAYPTPTTADVTAQATPYDVRTGYAEDVMKAYVDANLGPSAPAARKISTLTVGVPYGRGVTVKGSARFDVLYELLQSLADASTIAGTALGFEVYQVGAGLVFEVYKPTDRSKTVRLDIANNLLTQTVYSLSQPKFTRAIVGGGGDAAARVFLERTSATSLSDEAAWGRRLEQFVDARDTSDATALATKGDAALATDGRAQVTASVNPSDNQAMLFGIDWFLGDTVTVVVGSLELAAVVTELGLLVDADGVRLSATVGEPKLQTYEQQILARQADLAGRINNLETNK